MVKYTDSLRGYGHDVFERDGFKCQYCGADGTKSFDTWLTLSVDHLLPPDDSRRENIEFKVTACQFCNVADNLYFGKSELYKLRFDSEMTREALIAQRLGHIQKTRQEYKKFWIEKVLPSTK